MERKWLVWLVLKKVNHRVRTCGQAEEKTRTRMGSPGTLGGPFLPTWEAQQPPPFLWRMSGGGSGVYWSMSLVTLLPGPVPRSDSLSGGDGLGWVTSSWQDSRRVLSGSLCFPCSPASSRTGRCMSTLKSMVPGRRISMEMALPCGTPGTALCQVGTHLSR